LLSASLVSFEVAVESINSFDCGEPSGISCDDGEGKPREFCSRDDLGTNPDTYTTAQTPNSRHLSLLIFFMFIKYSVRLFHS